MSSCSTTIHGGGLGALQEGMLKFTLLRGGAWADLTTGSPCVDRDRTQSRLLLHGTLTTHPRREASLLTAGPTTSVILRDKGIRVTVPIPECISRKLPNSSRGDYFSLLTCPSPGAH